ncbi:MFS transporter [Streptomyces fuscichromogenes]|uniref:MFS transporter n=1 Tax=Streptomyces fuscichromogenes TaxID=1324013 RepID=A0A917X796_9ACTN|nr:MFS transporter [Streptomyces fuscichromogenes]GGM89393.1 MFS transporter [Streptomyces fuscichromogenes]
MTTSSWAVARLLRDRNAALYLTGVVVSGFGTSALWLVSGVWVRDLTGSDGLAALCTAALWAPTLLGPVLGTVADRVRRKPLAIRTNLALALLLLPLWTVRSAASVPLLFAVLLLYGAAGVVEEAAGSALVATAVDPALLGDFNGLRTTAREGMKLVAPLTGAALYTAYGGPGVALLDACTFVLAAGLWVPLRVREERPGPRRANRRREIAEGARLLWSNPVLRPLVRAGGATMCLASLGSSLNYAVVDAVGHSPAYTGVMYAVQGVGSVVVGLVSGPALRRLGERRFAAYGIALTGVAVAGRALDSDVTLLACSLAGGLGLPCVLIAAYTAVPREVPAAALGRATATADTLMFTPNVLGLAVGAALVELVDHRLLLLVFGGGLLATAASLAQRNASRTAARSPSDANPA